MTRILLIEPDPGQRARLSRHLEHNGYAVDALEDLRPLRDFDVSTVAAVVANACFSTDPGADVIPLAGRTPVVLLAEVASTAAAIGALKAGASDYLTRPFEPDELIASIERVATAAAPVDAAPVSAQAIPMIGRCPAMLELFERIRKVAPTDSTVLIQGESGTGKELVARVLHAGSRRRHAPMIALNCAAIPDGLIEAELFGHETGTQIGPGAARSGLIEAADAGTLFLDEIGELPAGAQARLLRVLQDGEIRRVGATRTRQADVRFITATHRDLRELTENGLFREDLFYRLNVVTLNVPPLRERGDDVVELAMWILDRAGAKLNKRGLALSDEALKAIRSYHWPGNVRELEHAVEHAVILCEGREIGPELLAIDVARSAPAAEVEREQENISLEDHFLRVVMENQDTHTETELAEMLGISRKSLWERRQRLNIPRRKTRKRGPRREG